MHTNMKYNYDLRCRYTNDVRLKAKNLQLFYLCDLDTCFSEIVTCIDHIKSTCFCTVNILINMFALIKY